jgi:hypothetical protein
VCCDGGEIEDDEGHDFSLYGGKWRPLKTPLAPPGGGGGSLTRSASAAPGRAYTSAGSCAVVQTLDMNFGSTPAREPPATAAPIVTQNVNRAARASKLALLTMAASHVEGVANGIGSGTAARRSSRERQMPEGEDGEAPGEQQQERAARLVEGAAKVLIMIFVLIFAFASISFWLILIFVSV